MPFEVRVVRPDEYEGVGEATSSAWHEYVELYPNFGWKAFLARVSDIAGRARRGTLVFGAFENQRPLGSVTLDLKQQSIGPYVLSSDTAYIGLLGVIPTARRRGVATALMEGAIQEARRRGMRAIVLTYDPVDVGPKELYDRLGFADTGERTTQGEYIARLDLST